MNNRFYKYKGIVIGEGKRKMTPKINRITQKHYYRKNKGDDMDYDELIFVDGKIGTSLVEKIFRINKFKTKDAGFFINTDTQGNFVLNPKEIAILIGFLISGLKKWKK